MADKQLNEKFRRIGEIVKHLRKTRTNLGYIDFAQNIGLNKKTYYRIERGSGDYYFSSLVQVISFYPDLSLADFFHLTEL